MPLKDSLTGIAHLALGKDGLDVLKSRMHSNTKPGESWTDGTPGATGVYQTKDHKIIVATNPHELQTPARTTIVYPESLTKDVNEAFKNATRKWEKLYK